MRIKVASSLIFVKGVAFRHDFSDRDYVLFRSIDIHDMSIIDEMSMPLINGDSIDPKDQRDTRDALKKSCGDRSYIGIYSQMKKMA